jgi:hypothetical protein
MRIIEYGSDLYGNSAEYKRLPYKTSAAEATFDEGGAGGTSSESDKIEPIKTSNVSEFTFILTLGIIALLLFLK